MKVLTLGLDGADPLILRKANCPNIKSIGEIQEIKTFGESARSWGAMITGAPPKKHGLERICPELDLFKLKVPPIWKTVNCSIGVAGLPIGHPPEAAKECKWFVGGLLARPSNYAYPPELMKELNKLGWREPFERDDNAPRRSYYTNDEFEEEWSKILPDRTKCFVHLLKEHPVDLGIIIWRVLDWIQHRLFFNQEKVIKWYEKMDREVGKVLDNIKADKVIIVSDHGFKRVYDPPITGHHRIEGVYLSNFPSNPKNIKDVYYIMKEQVK